MRVSLLLAAGALAIAAGCSSSRTSQTNMAKGSTEADGGGDTRRRMRWVRKPTAVRARAATTRRPGRPARKPVRARVTLPRQTAAPASPPSAVSSSSRSRGPWTCRPSLRAPARPPSSPRSTLWAAGAAAELRDRFLDPASSSKHVDPAADDHRPSDRHLLLRRTRLRRRASPDAAPRQREHRRKLHVHLRHVVQDAGAGRLPRARRRERPEEALRAL